MLKINKTDLSAYNEEVYLSKIWQGNTVFHETALFVPNRKKIKLLYPIDEVISLRSYSLKTEFIEGKDFAVTPDGEIEILKDSDIPVYESPLYTEVKPESCAFQLKDNPDRYLCFTGDQIYPKYAVAVTYKHTKTFDDGFKPIVPASQVDKLKNTIAKLERGEEVNIVVFGDSISCGWSSSGLNSTDIIYDSTNTEGNFLKYVINVPPFAPTWMDMAFSKLKKVYPKAKINVKNLSMSGMGTHWGFTNLAPRLALWKDENSKQVVPDLLLLGFGVNDICSNISTEKYKTYTENMIDITRTKASTAETEVLLYSPMIPTQKAVNWDKDILLQYEAALEKIASNDDKIGLLKLTSIFDEIVKNKEPIDYLNTNCNHGNDFTARIYATGVLAALGI